MEEAIKNSFDSLKSLETEVARLAQITLANDPHDPKYTELITRLKIIRKGIMYLESGVTLDVLKNEIEKVKNKINNHQDLLEDAIDRYKHEAISEKELASIKSELGIKKLKEQRRVLSLCLNGK